MTVLQRTWQFCGCMLHAQQLVGSFMWQFAYRESNEGDVKLSRSGAYGHKTAMYIAVPSFLEVPLFEDATGIKRVERPHLKDPFSALKNKNTKLGNSRLDTTSGFLTLGLCNYYSFYVLVFRLYIWIEREKKGQLYYTILSCFHKTRVWLHSIFASLYLQ